MIVNATASLPLCFMFCFGKQHVGFARAGYPVSLPASKNLAGRLETRP
jgi:hypothetical protein